MRCLLFFLFITLSKTDKLPIFYTGFIHPQEYVGDNSEIPDFLQHLYNVEVNETSTVSRM